MNNIRILSYKEIENIMECRWEQGINEIQKTFLMRKKDNILLPEKISQIFDMNTQVRINCMPATLQDKKICGVKWVSVFPPNRDRNLPNVQGCIILSEINTGSTVAFMDASWCTKYRTAAVGAIAAKYLAPNTADTIGLIGAGEQAKMHFELIKLLYPQIKKCYVSSHTEHTVNAFLNLFVSKYPDVEFISCGDNYQAAVVKSDIIVTATSTQQKILKADWLKKGMLYIHVGGLEDEYEVALNANKIVCDEWEAVKHRTQTISRMYQEKILNDNDIYGDLADIIGGIKKGRENDDEFIYFNSVGVAYVDMCIANMIYEIADREDIGTLCTV